MKVLIVEDNADTCELLKVLIQAKSGKALIAMNTSEALAMVRVENPHFVLLDLTIPGIPVEQFVKETRACSPNSRIIFASGHPEIQERAISLKADGFLMKPFDLNSLLKVFEMHK